MQHKSRLETGIELLRPWKLASLAIGLGLLIFGSYYNPAPDWDVGVSIVMALVAYTTAPWAVRVLRERRWKAMPLAAVAIWFGVDGCYAIYWSIVDPSALEMMRAGQWSTSLCLYLICGIVWMHRGPLVWRLRTTP